MKVIEDVKRRLDIVDIVSEYVDLKCSGRHYRALCPFHAEEIPSFVVYPDSQRWHCFGACDEGGDVLAFVQQINQWDFSTALRELARRAGVELKPLSPEERERIVARRSYEAGLGRAANHFAARLRDTAIALAYAQGRAWISEVIEEEELGYADGSAFPDLGDERAQRVTASLNRWAGSVGGALIYAHRERGHVVYLSGRSIAGKRHYNPSSDLAGPRRPYLNAVYASQVPALIIVESPACAISLSGWGIPALAMGGSGLNGDLPWRLQKHVEHNAMIYAVPDGDDRTDIDALAEVVGPTLGVVSLPEGIEDVNDWAQDGAMAEDFCDLMDAAPTWLDLEIGRVAQMQGAKRDLALEALFPLIARLAPITQARYKERITSTFEIGRREFNNLLKATQDSSSSSVSHPEILEGSYPVIAPALDFVDDWAIVTVPLLAVADGEVDHFPYLITSEREMVLLNGDGMLDINGRQVVLRDPPTMLGSKSRWAYTDIEAYLSGQDVDPITIYLETERLLDKYIDLKDEVTSDVLALWIMGTYLYPLFEAFPYVALMGPKNSGKSKLIGLLARLAFNGRVTSNVSPASLFRMAEATRGMLGIDEAERLANPRDPAAGDLRLLLNAGYKRGSPAIRCQGDDHQVVEFEVYGPKAIASIKGVEDVLESRCILINMLRTSGHKGSLIVSEYGEDWSAARNGLYCFALQHFTGVRDRYLAGAGTNILNNRQAELWRPLLSIADHLDRLGVDDLLQLVQAYALRKAEEKKVSGLDDWRYALLLALYSLTSEGTSEIRPKQVRDAMIDFLDVDADEDEGIPSSVWIGYRLREFGFQKSRHSRRGSIYSITRDEVAEVMWRYDVQMPEITGDNDVIGN